MTLDVSALDLFVGGLEHPIAIGAALCVILWVHVLIRRIWQPERREHYAKLMTLLAFVAIGYDVAFTGAFGFNIPLGPIRGFIAFITGVQLVAALAALFRPRIYE